MNVGFEYLQIKGTLTCRPLQEVLAQSIVLYLERPPVAEVEIGTACGRSPLLGPALAV